MKFATIAVTAILLAGCSTSGIICKQWRNKELSDERAAELLGISSVKTVVPPNQAPEIAHSDGTREKGKMIVTYQADFITDVTCTAIEKGMANSVIIRTLGR